jgi:hypothetical protein
MASNASVRPDRAAVLRRALRVAAAATLVGAVGFWAAKGARVGWSQHQVPVPAVDEITGLDYVLYEDRFIPGVEWLAAAAGVAVLLFGASFLFRSNSSQHA